MSMHRVVLTISNEEIESLCGVLPLLEEFGVDMAESGVTWAEPYSTQYDVLEDVLDRIRKEIG